MKRHLDGFALSDFRSFSSDLQAIAPLNKINFFAGQNNSGKSNIIRFAQKYLTGHQAPGPDPLESHLGETASEELPRRAISVDLSEAAIARIVDDTATASPDWSHLQQHLSNTLRALRAVPDLALSGHPDRIWIQHRMLRSNDRFSDGKFRYSWAQDKEALKRILHALNNDRRASLANALHLAVGREYSNDGFSTSALERLISWLAPIDSMPRIATIDAFRQIRSVVNPDPDASIVEQSRRLISGEGLIKKLQELERPDISSLHDKQAFERIGRFAQAVLDDPRARIEIPSHAEDIYVEKDGKTLPLQNLGTGVQQVIILAAAATICDQAVVCIEEPEIHLHPILQKKLVRYLAAETSNQYLIATHSVHMLDEPQASIFHVTNDGTHSSVSRASSPHSVSSICADLGYRASDILQANCVIWVEGPSDRLYIRHWINLLDPSLIEGVNYSIMFYGGRLLRHLSALDIDVDEFISLRRLNRNAVIVIDSDKSSAHGRINETKRRVRDSFGEPDSPGHAWVTGCRTIENYVPWPLLSSAFEEISPTSRLVKGDKWADPLARSSSGRVDKVSLARGGCAQWDSETPLLHDLRTQLRETLNTIREAND